MNIADKYYKAQGGTDGLRLQIKDYAEECARLRAEVARLKKEAKKGKASNGGEICHGNGTDEPCGLHGRHHRRRARRSAHDAKVS